MEKLEHNIPFKLFANCIAVKGFRRSTICDIQRQQIHLIPNTLFEIINNYEGESINFIKAVFDNNYDEIIDEYFNFLNEKELIFFTKYTQHFERISLDWKSSSKITNAIIDYDGTSTHDYQYILETLDKLNCKALNLRFFSTISSEMLIQILEITLKSRLKSIDIILKHDVSFNIEIIKKLCLEHQRISSIIIHSYSKNKIEHTTSETINTPIIYTTSVIDSSEHCGYINKENFRININLFTENNNFNSCLNRKLSIDVEGNIKNCPLLKKTYGHINDKGILEAVENENFKELWTLKKDLIEVCKDCEFRYICTDCRAHILDTNNIFSKPSKCTYDPYSGSW